MYTNSRARAIRGIATVALFLAASEAQAQNPPARLPAVVVHARPDRPGPNKLAGVVRDTFATPLDVAEIAIPQLQRRIFSRADGSFAFDGLRRGTYEVRVRKIGYAPQIQTIAVEDSGGVAVFALIPAVRKLEPVVTSASRGGLGGLIGDTSYTPLPGAEVRIVGQSGLAVADSTGHFFIPLRAGSYMASVTRDGYDFRLVSVIIPPDSGRFVTVFLPPLLEPVPHEQATNLLELNRRMVRRKTARSRVFTHAELEKMGVEWALDAVRRGAGEAGQGSQTRVDADCAVIVNGGPRIVELHTLTIDDVEAIEIYPDNKNPAAMPLGGGRGISPTDDAPIRYARWANWTKKCPLVFVWLR